MIYWPRRDARLSWPSCLHTEIVYPPENCHPSQYYPESTRSKPQPQQLPLLWFEPGCAWVQHANHSATEPPYASASFNLPVLYLCVSVPCDDGEWLVLWGSTVESTWSVRRSKVLSGSRSVTMLLAPRLYCLSMQLHMRPSSITRSMCVSHRHRHTHTHPFNDPLSGTTQVSRYQKGKTNLDFTEARDSEWQWHQLGYMQVCTSLQTGM